MEETAIEIEKGTYNQEALPVQRYEDGEIEIDLVQLLSVYIENIILIVIAAVVGAVIASTYTKLMIVPKYTASSKLYMISSAEDSVVDLSTLSMGTTLATDYEELIRIREVGETVIDKLDLPYSYEQLQGMISVSNTSGTRVLTISIQSTDPEEAMEIANLMADAAQKILPERTNTLKPKIVEYAVVPKGKSSPNNTKNTMMGALVGALIVVGVLTLLFITDNTFHVAEDFEREFGMMPLAVVPEGNLSEISDKKEEEIKKREKRARQRMKIKRIWERIHG